MNKKRLLKLADLLEADAKNKNGVKFDLRTVIDAKVTEDSKKIPVSCGTSACAMGLAALSGAFKRNGLSYRINTIREGSDVYNFIETTMHGIDTEFDDAACELFDIDCCDADFLFTPGRYPQRSLTGSKGELTVAKRIRDFVAGKVAP